MIAMIWRPLVRILKVPVLAAAVTATVLLAANRVAADGNPAAGKTVYEKRCVACHGPSGHGVGTIPNLSDRDYMAGRTDAQFLDKIAKGGQGSGMPAWEKLLSEQQRRDVLAYIRTFVK